MALPATGEEIVVLHTNLGVIKVRFFADKAPKHVESFKKLTQDGFYNGIHFHRVIPGFMIQGGCPNTKPGATGPAGTGGPGYKIPAEFNDVKHERGVLSAARAADPNSAGSQFFLMVKYSPHLDGQYSAFGEVFEGMDVVDKIVNLPRDRQDRPLPANPAIIESAELTTYGGAA
jgi:cyclophilin family peptidyl-prolyl cis-trans isomerase